MPSPAGNLSQRLIVRQFNARQDYTHCWQKMKHFTAARGEKTNDEVWLLQHEPVFTLGIRETADEILNSRDIPVVKSDRGGLVTYHGPGQLIVYLLLDLRRMDTGLKALINSLEQAAIDLLSEYGINASRMANAPGVYVSGKKIASLGLRVQRGCTYHGLSLNVDMDLAPFSEIVPCGLHNMQMTDMREQGVDTGPGEIGRDFVQVLSQALRYTPEYTDDTF